MGTISIEELSSLYFSGKSMWEIAQELGYSVHKIKYWMDKHQIVKRSRSEAAYVKLNPLGDPFKIKDDLSRGHNFLYGLGIGIYWGEGDKIRKSAIRVANTDPRLIRTFRKFLSEICGVQNNKISYSIVCFNDTDPYAANLYWSKEMDVLLEKFGKIVQIPTQGKGTYKRKSLYGVCTITVSNIKLKKWIMNHYLPG